MVAHVVLFTPKAGLTREGRASFVAALEQALSGIPFVQRAKVGRRFLAGRQYDALVPVAFEYFAVIEFATRDDLIRYLNHPAHDALAGKFYGQTEVAAAYDYDIVDGADARRLIE